MVVVPTLLTTRGLDRGASRHLEIHYLATPDGEIHFALLSDWTDARPSTRRTTPHCSPLAAEDRPAQPAARPAAGSDAFLLLHRRRLWNQAKAMDGLGAQARQAARTEPAAARRHRHELHADRRRAGHRSRRRALRHHARLPIPGCRASGAPADRQDGAPAESPAVRPGQGRVVAGYGVCSRASRRRCRSAREARCSSACSPAPSGIDPYAAAVSDVYQDLFGEGSYTGKGIYDVDAFEAALAGRVPRTRCSATTCSRAFSRARVSPPTSRWSRSSRRATTSPPRASTAGRAATGSCCRGSSVAPGAAIAAGRALEDARQSAAQPLAAGAAAGTVRRLAAAELRAMLLWIGFVLLTIALPPIVAVLPGIVPRREQTALGSHFQAVLGDLRACRDPGGAAHDASGGSGLADARRDRAHAGPALDHAPPSAGMDELRPGAGTRAPTTCSATTCGCPARWSRRRSRPRCRSPRRRRRGLSPRRSRCCGSPRPRSPGGSAAALPAVTARRSWRADVRALRLVARRTWRFFETFVTAADNMLPPDNFQEDPKPVVAHRTSPTNIGLYLLSVVTARDFGWIGLTDAIERLEATFATLEKLERVNADISSTGTTRRSAAADAEIRFHGRQRQPRRSSVRARQHLRGLDRDAAARRLEAGPRRHAWRSPAHRTPGRRRGGAGSGALASARRGAASLARRAGRTADAGPGAGSSGLRDRRDSAHAARRRHPRHRHAGRRRAGLGRGCASAAAGHGARRTCCSGRPPRPSRRHSRRSRPRHRGSCTTARKPRPLAGTSAALAGGPRRAAAPWRWISASCSIPTASCCRSAILVGDGSARPQLLRPARLRGAAGELYGHRQGRCAGAPLVPAGPRGDAGRARRGAGVLVGLDVRVPDAVAGHARADRQPARADQPADRAPPDRATATTLGLPWGISESAYNARDLELTYQYSNFGVPGLGLKRGLGDNAVVAPYATALAAMVDPPRPRGISPACSHRRARPIWLL